MEIDYDELGEIKDAWFGFRVGLPDYSSAYVSGEGDNPTAFIVGEAPGAQEEARHRPFVGPAGRALRDLMVLADLYAGHPHVLCNCWLTNVMKFRPARNRTPTPPEIKAARPLLRREWIAVGRPRLIIPVGGTALTAILGRKVSILRMSGKPHTYVRDGSKLVVWPMIHPAFGLRSAAARPLIEQDWEKLGEWRASHQG